VSVLFRGDRFPRETISITVNVAKTVAQQGPVVFQLSCSPSLLKFKETSDKLRPCAGCWATREEGTPKGPPDLIAEAKRRRSNWPTAAGSSVGPIAGMSDVPAAGVDSR